MIRMHRWFRGILLMNMFVLFGTFIPTPAPTLLALQHPAANAAQLIADTVVGSPVAAGNYLFWVDQRDAQVAIYSYNLDTQQETRIQELVQTYDVSSLVSDGQTVAWVDTTLPIQRIQSYSLSTEAVSTVITDTEAYGLGDIALEDGVLYYADTAPSHRGIYAYNLTTGQTQPVTPVGHHPVVNDGVLLWQDVQYSPGSSIAERSLYARTLDGSLDTTLIVSGTAAFSGYGIAGDHVVWSFSPPVVDQRVTSYHLATGNTQILSSQAGSLPTISQQRVAWREAGVSAQREMTQTLQVYDYTTNQTFPLIAESTAIIRSHTFVDSETMAVTLERNPRSSTNELYLIPLQQPGVRFDTVHASGAQIAQTGQVELCGRRLCVGDALWSPNGVQYFLPARGINGKTFCDTNYADDDDERTFWMNKADREIFADTVRIFAYAPDNPDCTPSVATLFDFAIEAEERGMRIGLVIHNIGMGFTFTQEQKDWLREVHDAFERGIINGKPALELIAYINVSNEINNYCSADADCFVTDTQEQTAASYVNDAVNWVREVTRFIRNDLDSPILLTVGMSTELPRNDGSSGAVNFFERDDRQSALVQFVDFLSPHNYGAGGTVVMQEIRAKSTLPVLLEEYGYATDPYDAGNEPPGANTWTEGLPEWNCAQNPFDPICDNTAPQFIGLNIVAMQTEGYSGGMAFMLTDMDARSCSGAFDLYTGLFTEGQSEYECNVGGGTYTRGIGTLKTTGRLVRDFHAPYRVFLPLIRR